MGEQMGYGIVNAIDPTGSHQVSIIAEMLYVLALLLFLASGLHHTLLAVLERSYHVLPPGGEAVTPGLAKYMMGLGTILFDFSLRFAMPVIVIVFTINVALGISSDSLSPL
jgi:flagellar biosynthetic protein FliR